MNFSILTLVVLVMLWTSAASTMAWDFEYGYRTVEAENAQEHVVEKTNIQITSEGAITYWHPVETGKEARMTQKFVFPNRTTDAFLNLDYLYVANYGGENFGKGSVWASKDGMNWVQLLDAPRAPDIAAGHRYSQKLPPALLGGTELWIQVRLLSQAHSPVVAQFLRYDTTNRTNNCFDLKVNIAKGAAPGRERQGDGGPKAE